MFALKALAMSLLTVARAGKWKRAWWVTWVRAVVALLPAVGGAAAVGRLASEFGVGPDWRPYVLLQVPVVAYILFGGFFVDHVISRIGALMTWVVHVVWVLIVMLVAGGAWIVLAALTGMDTGFAITGTWLVTIWCLPYMTVAFVLARLVPGSFPKAKPWHENVRDVKQAYRRLRAKGGEFLDKRAARKAGTLPTAQLPAPRPAKASRPTRSERRRALGSAVSPAREQPPGLPPGGDPGSGESHGDG